jgi:hypothetical protein
VKNYFSFTTGENGSLLTQKNKGTTTEFFLGVDNLEVELEKLRVIFEKHRRLPIYILVDNVGQMYNRRFFPASINIFDLQNVVRNKFRQETQNTDIKSYISLGRNKSTREFEYMFITAPLDKQIKTLEKFVASLDNSLMGIYLLPLEMMNLLKRLERLDPKNRQQKQLPTKTWNIIITANKVSGFRETVLQQNTILFTRILIPNWEDSQSFVENFRSNIAKTIDYMDRVHKNFNKNDLTITVLTNQATSLHLKTAVENFPLRSISYEQLIQQLHLPASLQQTYGDQIFQELVAIEKKVHNFLTGDFLLNLWLRIVQKLIWIVVVIVALMATETLIRIKTSSFPLKSLQKAIVQKEQTLRQKKEKEFGHNLNRLDEIVDVASFYVDSDEIALKPFDFLEKFAKTVDVQTLHIDVVNWSENRGEHNFKRKGKQSCKMQGFLTGSKNNNIKVLHSRLSSALRQNIPGYRIKITNLANINEFDDNGEFSNFPIKIEFMEE